jgi:hypothetical protein
MGGLQNLEQCPASQPMSSIPRSSKQERFVALCRAHTIIRRSVEDLGPAGVPKCQSAKAPTGQRAFVLPGIPWHRPARPVCRHRPIIQRANSQRVSQPANDMAAGSERDPFQTPGPPVKQSWRLFQIGFKAGFFASGRALRTAPRLVKNNLSRRGSDSLQERG